jgi:GT2 family glycosyltransferase
VSGAPDIVVAVYNAFDFLKPCVASLARTVDPRVRKVLIDDASTDPRVAGLFDELAWRSGENWLLFRNPSNLGFVRTANRGMVLSDRDVVLLNSDTRVTVGWLERLERCARSDPRIGTVTPFSNNGEICSFPEFCAVNPVPDDPEEIAAAMAASGPPLYPDLPTAVGFCMYIRRTLLDAIGVFDAERFSPGYGEENDFCMRAAVAGFRNVLCDDAYVVHEGGRSFVELGLKPDPASMDRVLERHPDYAKRVQQFIRTDPLGPVRERITATLQGAPGRRSPLL